LEPCSLCVGVWQIRDGLRACTAEPLPAELEHFLGTFGRSLHP